MGEDLIEFGMVEGIVEEPLGGAHRDPEIVAANIKKAAIAHIGELMKLSKKELLDTRYERFRRIGKFIEEK